MVKEGLIGRRELQKNLDKAFNGMKFGISDALKLIGALVTGKWKEMATGRPGPKVRTGVLRSSFNWLLEKMSVIVGTNVKYAPYLELGTSKMKPYPSLGPALQVSKKPIIQTMRKKVNENIKVSLRR